MVNSIWPNYKSGGILGTLSSLSDMPVSAYLRLNLCKLTDNLQLGIDL
jgi:hypothetical protein